MSVVVQEQLCGEAERGARQARRHQEEGRRALLQRQPLPLRVAVRARR